MLFNADIELAGQLAIDDVDAVLDELDGFGPALSESPYGRAVITVSVPAETLHQAVRTALALVAQLPVPPALAVEAMPSEEADRRAGLDPLPEILTVPEVADLTGLSRQRILQLVNAGELQHRPAGSGQRRTIVVSRSAAMRLAEKVRSTRAGQGEPQSSAP